MTTEQLLTEVAKRIRETEGPHDTPRARMEWFVAYQIAREMSELTLKDLARQLTGGGIPEVDDEAIKDWLDAWEEDGEQEGKDPDTQLRELLDQFFLS